MLGFQLVFAPVTASVTWPPCGTLFGVTLTMDAAEAVTLNVNGKIVALPDASMLVSRAVIAPTLATWLTEMLTTTSVGEFTVTEFTVISPVKSAITLAGEAILKFVLAPCISTFTFCWPC